MYLYGQSGQNLEKTNADVVSNLVYHEALQNTIKKLITKPSGASFLTLIAEAQSFRYVIGDAVGFTVASSTDVDATANTITKADHGFSTGLGPIQASTSSALPGGLSTSTNYWVIVVDDDTFQLASSEANAHAGTAINLTDAGTGNQTFARPLPGTPNADVTNGAGSLPLAAGATKTLAGPDSVTVMALADSAILTYYWT